MIFCFVPLVVGADVNYHKIDANLSQDKIFNELMAIVRCEIERDRSPYSAFFPFSDYQLPNRSRGTSYARHLRVHMILMAFLIQRRSLTLLRDSRELGY